MYSFGNASQVPPDSYASGPAGGGPVRGGGAGRPHHAHHSHSASANAGASADGIAASPFAQPATPAGSLTGNDALVGFLRDFGQFLKSAFDQIAALLGGGGAAPGANANSGANPAGGSMNGAAPYGGNGAADASSGGAPLAFSVPNSGAAAATSGWGEAGGGDYPGPSSPDRSSANSYQLTPGTPLELGNGETVLLGNDGSLRVTDGDAQGGRIVMTLARDGGFALGSAGSERTSQARPFGPALDPLLDDTSRPLSASQ
jgi:hypothetical protein